MAGLVPQLNLDLSSRHPRDESFDEPFFNDPAYLLHSRASSQQSNASCTPSPNTSTFSATSHTRHTSQSSVSSSPTTAGESDPFPLQKTSLPGLPEVAEDPSERFPLSFAQSPDAFDAEGRWSQDIPAVRDNLWGLPSTHDIRGGFGSDSEATLEPISKRRRSGESTLSSFANRMVTRFPSLSRRTRQRKQVGRAALSEPASQVTSPVIGRSRSNSRQRSFFGRSMSSEMELDSEEIPQAPSRIATIAEVDDQETRSAEQSLAVPAHGSAPGPEEPKRADTPLLPPMADEQESQPVQSPLTSPEIDWTSVPTSWANTPIDTPQLGAMGSPALSTKPSLSAMDQSYHDLAAEPSSEAMSILIDEDDEWSDRLGHANFHIRPNPYVPVIFSAQACDQLFKDWEKARSEYSKHLARTGTHFGHTSRVYRLTEEKWSHVDQLWKQNYGAARMNAADRGAFVLADAPLEPTPVVRVPELEVGKFPKLEDEGIVGAMSVQEPPSQNTPPISRRSSKKAQLKNVIGSIQRRNRSLSGTRT